MEFIICIFILKLALKWGWGLAKVCIKGALFAISLPFKLLFGESPILYEKPSPKPRQKACYIDPIDKAIDHWDNSPEDLDMEDMFWLDELWGDD